MIYITCPQCDTEHELPPKAAGTCVTCGRCGRDLEIAAFEEEEQVSLAPLEGTEPAPWAAANAATVLMKEPGEPAPEKPIPAPRRSPPSRPKKIDKPEKLAPAENLKTTKTKNASPSPSKKTLKSGAVKSVKPPRSVEPADEDDEEDSERPRWIGPAIVGVFVVALVAFGGVGGYYLLRASREKTPEPPIAEIPKPTLTIPTPTPSKGLEKDKGKTETPKLPPTPAPVASGREIYQELLKSTVWIVVRRDKGGAFGSGVLVDRTNRLVLTNHHVIDQSLDMVVFFPVMESGKLIVDPKHYTDKIKPAEQITGRVIAKDARRDLALVQVGRLPDNVPAVAVAAHSAAPGDPVHSIGNPGKSDGLWIYTSGTVRQVYHKKWQSTGLSGSFSEHEADIVETQSPTNPGDSGGPLVNSSGELVGITQGVDNSARLMSLFIDVTEITRFVDSSCKSNSLSWARATLRPIVTAANILDLVKELENADALARGKAAQALGEAGPAARLAVPALLKGLKDPDSLFRKLALEALEKIGAPDKSDIDLLRESLKDDNVTVRGYAAEALGKMGAEARAAAPDLAIRLKDDASATVRQHAARSLGRIGPPGKQHAFPALIAALGQADQGVRAAAAEAITSLGPLAEADRTAVLDMLKHEDADIRVFGVQALGQLAGQGKTVVPTLVELAQPGRDARLRRAALVSLLAFGKETKEAVKLLASIVKGESAELRQAACAVLLQLGAEGRSAAAALAEGLSTADNPTRLMLMEVLNKLGPDAAAALPALQKLLADKDSLTVAAALAVMGSMGKEARDAAPAIIVLLESKDETVFAVAVDTLGKIGKPAVPFLIGGMRDRNPNVRLGSVRATGLIGPDARQAAQPLAFLGQNDAVAAVRAEAAEAFRKVMSGPVAPPKKK